MPYSIDQEVAQARSRIAVAVRRDRGDAVVTDARRDLAAAKIAAYIAEVVAAAPPLSEDQRNRLASILLQGGGSA